MNLVFLLVLFGGAVGSCFLPGVAAPNPSGDGASVGKSPISFGQSSQHLEVGESSSSETLKDLMDAEASKERNCMMANNDFVAALIILANNPELDAYAYELACARAELCIKDVDLKPKEIDGFLTFFEGCATETTSPTKEETIDLLYAIDYHPNWCINRLYKNKFSEYIEKYNSSQNFVKLLEHYKGHYRGLCRDRTTFWISPFRTIYSHNRDQAPLTPKRTFSFLVDLKDVFTWLVENQNQDFQTGLDEITRFAEIGELATNMDQHIYVGHSSGSCESIVNKAKEAIELIQEFREYQNLRQYLRFYQGKLVESCVFGPETIHIEPDRIGLQLFMNILAYYEAERIHPERITLLEEFFEVTSNYSGDENSSEIIRQLAHRVAEYPNLATFLSKVEAESNESCANTNVAAEQVGTSFDALTIDYDSEAESQEGID